MNARIGLATVAALGCALVVSAGGPAPKDYAKSVTHVPAEKRLHAVKNGVIGKGTNELVPRDMDLGVRVSMGRKAATPPVTAAEAHATFGHVYLIEEGEGTLVLGGELVDAQESRPGEWTAASVRGGQEYRMKKGDMITVQVGMPHQWKEVGSSGISYLAFHSFPDRHQPK